MARTLYEWTCTIDVIGDRLLDLGEAERKMTEAIRSVPGVLGSSEVDIDLQMQPSQIEESEENVSTQFILDNWRRPEVHW